MRCSHPTLLTLLALSAFGCDSEVPVAPDLRGLKLAAMTATAEAQPFNAKFTGNAHLSPTDNPCVLRNKETGSGTATHLGHFAWLDVESADFCAVPGGVSVHGSFVMTAANGDKLVGGFTTTGTFAQNGDLLIQGTYTFTGGTGRFANAAGSGNVHATGLPSPGLPFSATFDGAIRS